MLGPAFVVVAAVVDVVVVVLCVDQKREVRRMDRMSYRVLISGQLRITQTANGIKGPRRPSINDVTVKDFVTAVLRP